MKKYIAFFIALLLCLSATTALAWQWDESEIIPGLHDFGGETVVIASPYDISLEPGLNYETDLLIERIAQLEENWNVHVEFKQIDATAFWDNMSTTVMSGDPYGDVMFGFPWYMDGWIAAGAVRDVAPLMKELGYDVHDGSWGRSQIADNTIGNALYGFSRGYDQIEFALIYNPRVFEEAGLTDPNTIIDEGGVWTLDMLKDYAKKLTAFDEMGAHTQVGLIVCDLKWTASCFVLANGGEVVEFDENGYPSLGLGSAKALEGLDIFYNMAYNDQSLIAAGWDSAVKALLNGTAGMHLCEQWVLEYIPGYLEDAGIDPDYALTYFPVGSEELDYMDINYGGSCYFIPTSISDERAKMALAVYAALYQPTTEMDQEEMLITTAEEFLADEKSLEVYVDIIMNKPHKSSQFSRVSLFEVYNYMIEDMFYGSTPQSVINSYQNEVDGILADCAYVKTLESQK